MGDEKSGTGPIMRLFEARIRDGYAESLMEKVATTSADVVRNEPGNAGYFFGQGVAADADRLVFVSFWDNLDAIKRRFGDDWQSSFLPEGYEEMIEEHAVRHIDLGNGWFVRWDG